MAKDEVTTGEIMEFLREHMPTKEETATKEELRELRQEMRQELSNYVTKEYLNEKFFEFKSEILTAIDSFAKRTELFEQELIAMRMRYERHEERLEVVEQELGISAV